ncbi:hypothetical protein [Streptomyces sp. NBC_00105]|uniref:hypothetical protein n=1 Tax=Streptomyces sp. NBC_00105 TaxID=2903622 RepID=UPI003251C6C7
MAEWLWRELVKVTDAGPQGLPSTELFETAHLYVVEGYPQRGNRPYLASVRYEMRKWNLEPYDPPAFSSRSVFHYRFTEAGREHHVERLEA